MNKMSEFSEQLRLTRQRRGDEFKYQIYTYEDMIYASKYGYNFHKTTSFPNQEFEDSCVRNTQQWMTTLK